MTKNKLAMDHQVRVAKVSISPSAFRGQGKKGLIQNTRRYLENINLNEFAKHLENGQYSDYLDQETKKLHKSVSTYSCQWGTARKGLNIFFRDVLYNSFFFKTLKLKFEYGNQMEIPLDSKTMKEIREKFTDLDLQSKKLKRPTETAIIRLTPTLSRIYQEAATAIAKISYPGYTRVDLDMEFWTKEK